MTDTIPPTPEVPPGLREAAQLTKLIPFVGAGASKLAGCPDWNEFADEALRVFVEHGKFSHAQLDQVKTLSPPGSSIAKSGPSTPLVAAQKALCSSHTGT